MYLTETRLSRNGVWCAEDNHNCYMTCAKEYLDSNFELSGYYTIYHVFHEIAPNFKY